MVKLMQDNVKFVVAVVMAVLGSTGIQMSLPVRNDPFTGSQAELQHARMESRMEKRMVGLERKLDLIEYRMTRAGINGVHK